MSLISIRDAEHWQQILVEARENRAQADRTVTPEQEAQAKPGESYFVRLEWNLGLTIYGEIIAPKYEEDRAQYAMPHMRYVRLTKSYSQIEPDGEYGNVHIASMTAFISKEDFEVYREKGWPSLI